MSEFLAYVVPAALAFAGTALGVSVAYRRWKSEQRRSQRAPFLEQRKAVYQEFWRRIEDVHFLVRTKELGDVEIRNLLQDLNKFMLRQEIYMEDDLRQLANDYIRTLHELAREIRR